MQAEQQSELLPCPFCGHVTAPKMTDSYAFQDEIGGEFDESNAVYFAVVCDASKPNGPGGCGGMGGFAATESEAIALWQARAALSHPSTPQGWVSVNDALPPEREMVAVGWMDVEDHDHADRYSIDYLDDGVWQFYFSEHEHYLIAGVAKGRSEDAPYTHWHRIGKIPPPPEQGGRNA